MYLLKVNAVRAAVDGVVVAPSVNAVVPRA